jgi:hypothetical protein
MELFWGNWSCRHHISVGLDIQFDSATFELHFMVSMPLCCTINITKYIAVKHNKRLLNSSANTQLPGVLRKTRHEILELTSTDIFHQNVK